MAYSYQKGKLVKKLTKATEPRSKSKLQTEAVEFSSAGLTELQKLAGIRPKYRDLVLVREAESPVMAEPPRPQGDQEMLYAEVRDPLAETRKLAGITPKYHAHLLDETEALSDREKGILHAFWGYKPAFRKRILAHNKVTPEELADMETKGLLKSPKGKKAYRLGPKGKKLRGPATGGLSSWDTTD